MMIDASELANSKVLVRDAVEYLIGTRSFIACFGAMDVGNRLDYDF